MVLGWASSRSRLLRAVLAGLLALAVAALVPTTAGASQATEGLTVDTPVADVEVGDPAESPSTSTPAPSTPDAPSSTDPGTTEPPAPAPDPPAPEATTPAPETDPAPAEPQADGPLAGTVPEGLPPGAVIPGEYVVTVEEGVDPAEVAIGEAFQGNDVDAVFDTVIEGFAATLEPEDVARLEADPRVDEVEPDRVVAIGATQPSPPWGLDRVDQASLPLDAKYTYDSNAAGVTVYVIDTGVRADHVDFGGRVVGGYSAIADGQPATSDCHGHGTHVAGTIGGSTYGLAKGVTIVPVRVLNCSGSGSTSGVIAGIDWVTEHHQPGTPAVANMSLGGSASNSLDAAVDRSVADGVTHVVAAGNDNTNACTASPARASAAITTGATTSNDSRASYSNYGSCLDVFAPGSGIVSASAGSASGSTTMSGTSMASPHVAGAAALYLAGNPSASPATVADAIVSKGASGVVGNAGSGSPNVLLQSRFGPNLPEAPTNLEATPGDERVTISWEPGGDGGSPITGYAVTAVPSGISVNATATDTSVVVDGLTNGTTYTFTVAAINAVGTGAPATTAGVTPDTVGPPARPTSVSASAGDSSASVTWTPPDDDGGSPITGYEVTTTSGGTTTSVAGDATSAVVEGLVNGQEVRFRVRAVNDLGTSIASSATSPVIPRPANDKFAAATTIDGTTGTIDVSNVGATRQAGEPMHAGVPGSASVWFKWTAPTTVDAAFQTAGSTFDTLLAVYKGSKVSALTAVAGNDDASGISPASRIGVRLRAGETIWIAVDGFGTSTGDIRLAWFTVPVTIHQPDLQIRRTGATYVGVGIYRNITAQTVKASARRRSSTTYTLRFRNDGTATENLRVRGTGSTSTFAVRYYYGGRDVTTQVVRGTFSITAVAPGTTRTLTLRVAPTVRARPGSLGSAAVTARTADGSADGVRAVTRAY